MVSQEPIMVPNLAPLATAHSLQPLPPLNAIHFPRPTALYFSTPSALVLL